MTAVAKLVAEMRKAAGAWDHLHAAEKRFRAAWEAAAPNERLAAFARLGIEATEGTSHGDAHDAFTGFGC